MSSASTAAAAAHVRKMIIGITGTLGAGKGAVVDYLTTRHEFLHFSARALLTELVSQRNLPVNRDSMVLVANELRRENSPAFVAEELLRKANEALGSTNSESKQAGGAIIESIRTEGEVQALRRSCATNFILVAVDAPAETRFQRIQMRRSATDNVTFEKFKADEEREMESTEPHKQNLKRCIELADVHLNNSGGLDELHRQVDEMVLHSDRK